MGSDHHAAGNALRVLDVYKRQTFTHAENSFTGKVRAFFMKLAGFPLHSLSLIHISIAGNGKKTTLKEEPYER